MAFWNRFRQSQLQTLSNQIRKCYLQTCATYNTLNHTALHTRTGILNNTSFAILNSHFEFPDKVRTFAAPVQAKKKEEKDTGGPRLNERITAQFVRLVSDEGHSIVSRHEALEQARRLKLDLVEVQRNAEPPVCKFMDYNKERYKQQMKDKERAKTKTDLKKGIVKEVRFSGQITQNDLQLKADTVKRLLEEGYRVKCMVTRKKEGDDLDKLLSRFFTLVEEIGMVENGPRVEEQQAHLVLRHVKLGPSKKGSGKKVSKAAAGPTEDHIAHESSLHFAETSETMECYLDDEYGKYDADKLNNKSTWSSLDSKEDFDTVFDDGNGVSGVVSNKVELATVPESLTSPAARSSQFIGQRSTVDPALTHAAALGTENRYRREPRSSTGPARSINSVGPGVKQSRPEPPVVDQGRQSEFNVKAPPHKRETVQHEAQLSRFGNSSIPANKFPKQTSYGLSENSPASSYGNFSSSRPESNLENQNIPAEGNRYKRGNPSDPARSSSSMGSSAHRNSPHGSRHGGVPGIGKDVHGKFGIFSSKGSDVIQSRNTENQVKVER